MSAPAKVAGFIVTFLLLSLATVIAVREGRGEGGYWGRSGDAVDRGDGGEPAVHEVHIRAMRFEPAVIDARPGDTVVWINDDFLPHTATSQDGSWDSGSIVPGASWTLEVGADATGEYLCTLHPVMTGKLR